jgi:hypothetical protein
MTADIPDDQARTAWGALGPRRRLQVGLRALLGRGSPDIATAAAAVAWAEHVLAIPRWKLFLYTWVGGLLGLALVSLAVQLLGLGSSLWQLALFLAFFPGAFLHLILRWQARSIRRANLPMLKPGQGA